MQMYPRRRHRIQSRYKKYSQIHMYPKCIRLANHERCVVLRPVIHSTYPHHLRWWGPPPGPTRAQAKAILVLSRTPVWVRVN